MATTEKVKTGTDFTVKIDMTLEVEVVTNLTQIFIEFYYELNGKITPFSFFAKDLADQSIIDRANELGVTVHQMLFEGEIIVCDIPKEDTDTLKINQCNEVAVFAEVSFVDSDDEVQKFTEKDDEGNECDKFIVILEKSVTEKWL